MKGDRFPLPTDRPIKIGRARRGVCLNLDELASLEHAEISTVDRGFWIADAGSQTGTFVAGNRITRDGQKVEVGELIEIGGSVLHIEKIDNRSTYLKITLAVLAVTLSLVVAVNLLARRDVHYHPVLVAGTRVTQGPVDSAEIPVPLDYIRRYGVDHRQMSIQDVTDYDDNGVDEVWIALPDRRLVVTFNPAGAWVLLGELPLECSEREGLDFPEFVCAGRLYQHQGDSYAPAGIDGVLAWVRTPVGRDAPTTDQTPLRPYLFTLVHPGRLVGFLQDRGVDEPIHYLVCEETLPDIRAHVLTVDGRAVPLARGCLGDLEFTGPQVGGEFGAEQPRALAFTVGGRHALIDDLRRYATGGADGLFSQGASAKALSHLDDEPANRSGTRIGVAGEPGTGSPIAPEAPVPGARALTRTERAAMAPPAATTTAIPGQGVVYIDPEGCAELEVETGPWHCAKTKGCRAGTTFVEVREVGCSEPHVLVEAPYVTGRVFGKDKQVEVVVDIQTGQSALQVDVLRTLVSHRLVP